MNTDQCPGASVCCNPSWCKTTGKCLHQQPGQQPRTCAEVADAFVAGMTPTLTGRELELLQGLIERELWHAKTCDAILARPDGNHRMARAQKGWDMERVALLRKLGGLGA